MVSPSALQAGHGTAAGFPHPGHRHQQAERVPDDFQRTPGQPGPGPAPSCAQTLHPAGTRAPPPVFPRQRTEGVTFASAMCLQIALKCADVCNPCRVWELSRQWSERVCEEFYRQGESKMQTATKTFTGL